MKAKINKVTITIVQTNIYALAIDAIVHDTDSALTIPPVLARAAGEYLVQEVNMIGWCDIGAAVITGSGGLNSKHIIHVVTPRWGDDSVRGKLENAVWEVLQLAENNKVQSLAIPPIATGANGYPIENCAKVTLEQIIDFTFERLQYLREIVLCMQTAEETAVFRREFERQIEILKNSGDGKVRA